MNEPVSAGDPFLGFLPLIILTVFSAVAVWFIAREKGRSSVLWAGLTLIPIVNFGIVLYIVGAPSLRIERKIDQLIKAVNPGATAGAE